MNRLIIVAWLVVVLCASAIVYLVKGFDASDFWNGAFEFGGSLMLLRNVLQLHKDKMVRGYHWWATAFFMSWGYWNLYYYPHLDQWWSFTGGLFVVAVNTFWLAQMWYYRKN